MIQSSRAAVQRGSRKTHTHFLGVLIILLPLHIVALAHPRPLLKHSQQLVAAARGPAWGVGWGEEGWAYAAGQVRRGRGAVTGSCSGSCIEARARRSPLGRRLAGI